MARRAAALLVALALATAVCAPARAGVDYVGLRVSLPLGNVPVLVGLELGVRLPIGWATASLLLAPDGKTLLVGGVDWAVGPQGAWGGALIRFSVGLSYFDLTAALPTPLFGGGIAWETSPFPGARVAVAAEMLYPVAIGPPLITLGGGWSPP